MKNKFLKVTIALTICSIMNIASAGIIHWADWESETVTENATTVSGKFVTNTSTVDIEYKNTQGIHFLQTGTGIDYFSNSDYSQSSTTLLNPNLSPYTSSVVDNIPTAAEMIALKNKGSQTLSFSESVANIVFSYVSLNDNGYSFDQDFDILSVGSVEGNEDGYFGAGTSTKEIIDHGNGNIEYRLVGAGEAHGTIQFKGSFDQLTWNSLNNETWNGFTVGIEGTTTEVPEPTTLAIFSLAMFGLITRRFNQKN
ncbi:PEP-CTERM sorting domain-containing protein [Colwellia sp. 6_MG-2023]|uniref:PEP-CTERM sorting domain-containing protein n=1 Tax=Colwellia sp. 6_MG-2023 TaxID=3062676 RepID=UPI0026E21743|nr:PEP-CTERM sorting domain-containing protein [Colwellia sp. 6_MG-2023]MDO6486811.1 PEP-CTERM sorting domain-containing protein [Colwellia sp. 6_MG-2023]